MISAQTRSALVAKENRFPPRVIVRGMLFRIMLQPRAASKSPPCHASQGRVLPRIANLAASARNPKVSWMLIYLNAAFVS